MQKNNLKHYLHLHLIVFIWGFTAVLGKLISIDSIPLVWFRMLLASFFIALYFILKNKSFKLDFLSLLKFLISGILIALHWITFFKAIKVSNVSVALVTMSTGALFTSLIEPFFFKRKIKSIEIILGIIVVGGLYIIFSFKAQYTLGIIFALISSFLASLFSVLNGLFVRKNNASLISLYQLFFGALFITFFMFFQGSFTYSFFVLPISDWIYILILSSICTAYAFIVSIDVMKHLTPYTVMLTINLEPVYAIILALIVFGESEKMNSEFYFGAGIVLFVVLLNGILKNMKSITNKLGKFKHSKK
tara:strand:- start:14795 stop:15709 length:915 start_codon:yes stop_codon:yes gene_type:complete